jgi:arsenical pump membrane protein
MGAEIVRHHDIAGSKCRDEELLPISNPANLVIFAGGEMPPLARWMSTFMLPSIVSIVTTFGCLYWTQRRVLASDSVA